MKKLKFVSLMIAALFMGFGFTSCEEDESILTTIDEDKTPQLVVLEGETDEVTIDVTQEDKAAGEVIVTVKFKTTDATMRRLYMTQNIAGAGDEKFELDIEDLNKKADGSINLEGEEKDSLVFDIPFPVLPNLEAGTVVYELWTTSGRGDYRDVTKRWVSGPGTVILNYGGENDEAEVKEYTEKLLYAPLGDGSSKTFMSVLDGQRYQISEGVEMAAYWDFGYYYGNNDEASLASPAAYPALFNHDDDTNTPNIAISELTSTPEDELNNFFIAKSEITADQFDLIEVSSDLDEIVKPDNEIVSHLIVGDILEFVDNYGKKGVIKVNEIKGTWDDGDYIELIVKVQP